MNPRALVRPLDPPWQAVLDAALRPRGYATTDIARLAPRVQELSAAYNAAEAEGRRTKLPLEARIAFSFPRDVPKGAAAVRELIASGLLALPRDRPLRVLDLGAGLGAMTWGVVQALRAAGASGRVEALLVDEDPSVLEAAVAIGRAAHEVLGASPVELGIATQVQSLGRPLPPGAYDLVLVGQVLSELDPRLEVAARLDRQVALLEDVLSRVAPDGALVVVEPALRERTRHLHALRDRLLERRAATVFAPCLHAASCPMLPLESEWCHEDLPVDLPSWTVPLARAAGLRWQGLTFSYLVLRKDGRTALPSRAEPGQIRFRAVSDLLRSKGKAELFICAEDGARRRIRQLEREAHEATGIPFDDLGRGDVVTLTDSHEVVPRDPRGLAYPDAARTAERPAAGPIDDRGRVAPGVHVAIDVGAPRQ